MSPLHTIVNHRDPRIELNNNDDKQNVTKELSKQQLDQVQPTLSIQEQPKPVSNNDSSSHNNDNIKNNQNHPVDTSSTHSINNDERSSASSSLNKVIRVPPAERRRRVKIKLPKKKLKPDNATPHDITASQATTIQTSINNTTSSTPNNEQLSIKRKLAQQSAVENDTNELRLKKKRRPIIRLSSSSKNKHVK